MTMKMNIMKIQNLKTKTKIMMMIIKMIMKMKI